MFLGGLEYFGAENMVVRPFWDAFSRPILGWFIVFPNISGPLLPNEKCDLSSPEGVYR